MHVQLSAKQWSAGKENDLQQSRKELFPKDDLELESFNHTI
jgi:hypothetical protein